MKKKLNTKQLAAMVGCTIQNVHKNRNAGNLIADESGRFDMSVQINAEWLRARREGPAPAGREARPGTEAERKRAEDQRLTRLRRDFAKMKILEAQALAAVQGQYETDDIIKILPAYCDRLGEAVTATTSLIIEEIGAEILAAGRVLPASGKKFEDHFLKLVHDHIKKFSEWVRL